MLNSILTKNQKLKLKPKTIKYYNEDCTIYPTIRYDDECNNGHNTFAITCEIRDKRGTWIAGGCCHEAFIQAYPEFKHLIKWHLCGSEQPLYYIENTLYHASNSASSKYKAGEPNRWQKVLTFKNSYITHKFPNEFITFLENKKTKTFKIVEIAHKKDSNYDYSPNYTFKGFECEWYQCPFNDERTAIEFQKELSEKEWEIKTIITGYQESKPRDFAAARKTAIWEDATEAQLSLPREELKKLLLQRLPKLMKAFKKDIEALGFIY